MNAQQINEKQPYPYKHGLASHPLHAVWDRMKRRCYNPRYEHFERYGGRGITVCDEWRDDFKAFYDWAVSNGYENGLTLDRADNDGNYTPDNCRWVTQKEQSNNRASCRMITRDGITKTVTEWAESLGIKPATLYARLFVYKWEIDRAFSEKVRSY